MFRKDKDRWAWQRSLIKLDSFIIIVLIILFLTPGAGCKGGSSNQARDPAPLPLVEAAPMTARQRISEQLGIEIVGIRLSAGDHMLDFRYKVIDPEKASLLLRRQSEVYLIDQSTGIKVSVPRTKLGSMRQTAVHPLPNRVYFILFSNPNRLMTPGSRVTLVIGDLKVQDLVIE